LGGRPERGYFVGRSVGRNPLARAITDPLVTAIAHSVGSSPDKLRAAWENGMPVLEYEPEMTWRYDGCQRLFQVVYDDQTEEERDEPSLLTSDERTFCEPCRAERFGAGPYEPE
jgi:hypothetical protein